jgi:hypothetical protein
MHAATDPPPGLSGFSSITSAGIQLFFRGLADRQPDTLEIAVHGRCRPAVEASSRNMNTKRRGAKRGSPSASISWRARCAKPGVMRKGSIRLLAIGAG